MPEPQITEADIERWKQAFERFNEGDFDVIGEFVSADVQMERVIEGELPVTGRDNLRAFLEPDMFAWQRFYPLDWTVNDDKVLVHLRLKSKFAGSGIELDVDAWMVWTVDDGVVVHMANFTGQQEAEARQAAGLGQNASP
jgi:ketosteroid isomerase-like protein